MKRLLMSLFAAVVMLGSVTAQATRTEVSIPGLPGQYRMAWDSTRKALIFEVESEDVFQLTKRGHTDVFVREDFNEGATKGFYTIQLDGTVADLSTGVYNMLYVGNGNSFVYAALGAGQTLDMAMAAGGLDISGDATDDEGYEIMGGILGASGRPFVVGTDPAFQFCATVTFGDISDTDEWHMGFRTPQTINAAFNDYDDYATIGTIGEANPATLFIETAKNDAGDASTDTTQTLADATEATFCTLVSAAGAVTYTINGSAPTVTAAFSFTDGDLVIPFIHSLHGTSSSMGCVISDWTVGYQP